MKKCLNKCYFCWSEMEKSFLGTLQASIWKCQATLLLSIASKSIPRHTADMKKKTKEVIKVLFFITYTLYKMMVKNLIFFYSQWANQRRHNYLSRLRQQLSQNSDLIPLVYYSIIHIIPLLFGILLHAAITETGMEAKFLYSQPSGVRFLSLCSQWA